MEEVKELVSFRAGDSDIYCHKFLNLFSIEKKIENGKLIERFYILR